VISRRLILVSFHCLAVFDFLLARPSARELLSEKHRTLGIKVSL
jgi:hypothetical protein